MAEDEEKGAFTIKAFPVDARKLAVASATKRGETMGQWMSRAVTNQANLERGDSVTPPGQPPEPEIDLPAVTDLLRAATDAATAAGLPLPKTTARHAFALADAQLRSARGLPPKAKRLPPPRVIGADRALPAPEEG